MTYNSSKKYDINFLKTRGFVFQKKDGNYFSVNKSYILLYREFEDVNDYNFARKELFNIKANIIFWFHIKKLNIVTIQRLSGENNIFTYIPCSITNIEYKKEFEKLLDSITEKSLNYIFYNDFIYKILFKDFWNYVDEISQIFKYKDIFTKKESILLAQYSILSLFFLFYISSALFNHEFTNKEENNSDLLTLITEDPNLIQFIINFVISIDVNFESNFQLDNKKLLINLQKFDLFKFYSNNFVKSAEYDLFEQLTVNKEIFYKLKEYNWKKLIKKLTLFNWVNYPLLELSEKDLKTKFGNISPYIFEYYFEFFILPVKYSDTKKIELKSKSGLFNQKLNSKRAQGTYYTPSKISRKITSNAIIEYSQEKNIEKANENLKKITILDPAAGTGNFVLEAAISLFEHILMTQRNFLTETDILELKQSIVENNIFGIDISESSTEICKLRLILWMNTKLSLNFPLNFTIDNMKVGNSLVGYISIPENLSLISLKDEDQNLLKNLKNKIEEINLNNISNKIFSSQANILINSNSFFNYYQEIQRFIRKSQIFERINYFTVFKSIYEYYNKILSYSLLLEIKKQLNVDVRQIILNKPYHWILDFYNVWLTGGFDLIVGNPPFISYYASKTGKKEIDDDLRRILLLNYDFIENPNNIRQRIGSSMFFLERSIKLLKQNYGKLVFILDMNIYVESYSKIRKYLLMNTQIDYIVENIQEFDVNSSQIVLSLQKKKPLKSHEIIFYDSKYSKIGKKLQLSITEESEYQFEYEDPVVMNLLAKFNFLNKYFKVVVGYNTAGASDFFSENPKNYAKPYVKGGSNIQRWKIIYPSNLQKKKRQLFLIYDPSLIKMVTERHKSENKGLPGFGNKEKIFNKNKIFMRQSGDELVATIDEKGFRATHSIFMIYLKNAKTSEINLKIALASLNCAVQTYYARKRNLLHTGPGKIPQITTNATRKLIYINPKYPIVVEWLIDRILLNQSLCNENEEKKFIIELFELCMFEISLTEETQFQKYILNKLIKSSFSEKGIIKEEFIQTEEFMSVLSLIQNSKLVLDVVLWTRDNIKNKKEFLLSYF